MDEKDISEKKIEELKEEDLNNNNNSKKENEEIYNKINKQKENNYQDFYKKQDYCDVKIKERWVTGRILEKDSESATIRDFENPNETIKVFLFDNESISYFRKYSKPSEYRRKCTRDNIKNLKITKDYLDNLICFNFGNYNEKNSEKYKNVKPYDMITNLRGKVYYWFDNVMNINDNDEGIDVSIQIFELIFILIKNYFIFLKDNNDIVIKYQNICGTELEDIVLFDMKYSVVSFREDALKIYYKIMGQNPIYNDFYINYSSFIENYVLQKYKEKEEIIKICNKKIYTGDITGFRVNENQSISTIQLAYFIDFCKNIDFFQTITDFITSNNDFSFNLISEYILLFKKTTSFLEGSNNQLTNKLTNEVTQLKNYIYNRIENLNENEVYNNPKEKIINLCLNLVKILPYEETNQSIIFEGIYLNYINACFKCNKLEKKIFAINTYNSIIKSIDSSSNKFFSESLNCSKDRYIKYMNYHTLNITLVNIKILDYLLEENCHQELIKRSLPIIISLYKDNFTLKEIEIETIIEKRKKIIDCLFKKLYDSEKNDENETKIIKDIISKLTLFVYEDDRDYAFLLIKNYIKEREISKDNINLIKDFTINYLSDAKIEVESFNKDEKEVFFKDIPFEEKKFLGIQIIWNYLSDKYYKEKDLKDNKKIIEIIENCINALKEIFDLSTINDKLRENILMKILNNINNNESNVQSFFLLKSLLKNMKNSNRFNQIIKNIHKKNNIFDLIVDDLTNYNMKVESIENNEEQNDNNDKINDFANTIFEGFYPHSINISIRIELIFILLNKERNLEWNFDNFLIFWKFIVKQRFSKEIFFKVLFDNINNISYQFRSNLFKQIFLNPKLFVIDDLYSFNLFKKLMYEINISNKVFIILNKTDLRVDKNKNNEITGLNKLWDVLISTKNIEVQNEISSFLADIYLNVTNPRSSDTINFWESFKNTLILYLNKTTGKIIKEKEKEKVNFDFFKNIPEKIEENKKEEEKKEEEKKEEEKKEEENKEEEEKKEEEKKKEEEEKKEDENKEEDNKEDITDNSTENTSVISKNDQKKNEIGIKGLLILINKLYAKIGYQGTIVTDLSGIPSSDPQERYLSFKFINSYNKKTFRENVRYDEQFYILRYKISRVFDIPKNKIQFQYDFKADNGTNSSMKFDLSNDFDFFNYSIIGDKKYDPSQILEIYINIIENPIIEIPNNPKFLLESYNELYKILTDLLKEKNKSYTLDIWNLLKDDLDKNDDLNIKIKNFIMDINGDFDTQINETFNFENSSSYYKSYLLSHLNYVLDKNKEFKLFLEQFVHSKIWKGKIEEIIKNFSVKIENEETDLNEKIKTLHTLDYFTSIFKFVIPLEKEEINNLIIQKILQFVHEIFYNAINGEIKGDLYYAEVNSIQILFDLITDKKMFFKFINNILNLENEKQLFISILVDGLILSKNNLIKIEFKKFINKIYENDLFDNNKDLLFSFSKFLFLFLFSEETLKKLKEISKNNENISFEIYFEVCDLLIEKIYPLNIEFDYNNYVNDFLLPEILSQEIKEELLSGFLLIIYSISKNYKIKYKEIEGKQFDFAHFLFYDLLYNKCSENPLSSKSIIIKNTSTFRNASNLLIYLIINDEIKRKEVLTKLYQYNSLQFWKSSNLMDWKLSFEDNKKNKFVGLKNLGCTCYMNSLFQVLFFIPSFRESILNSECKIEEKNALYQLKYVFNNLKFSDCQYFTPIEFTKNFDNEELNVREQMDIDEFFNLLIDKIENHLKGTNNENLIKYFFQGRNTDELIFQENCNHHRKNDISFYSIQLQIMNKKNIYESLDSIIDGELMNGENSIFCQSCNKKIPAIKHQSFKTLPRILIFVLKRFEFNYNTMTKTKINDYYEFPLDLDMTKYTSDYLNNKDNYNSNNNNKYKLKSFVVHSGSCELGHYYSFIFDNKSNQWYQFNDSNVSKFNIENLKTEAFGGYENYYNQTTKKEDKIVLSRNAYLLFYEKEDMSNCENYDKVEIVYDISDNIKESNISKKVNQNVFHFHLEKIIFSQEYHRFILQFLTNLFNLSFENNQLLSYIPYFSRNNDVNIVNKDLLKLRKKAIGSNLVNYINLKEIEVLNSKKENKQINLYEQFKLDDNITMSFQFLLLFFFNVLVRSREKYFLGGTVDLIKFCLNEYKECSEFLIEEFSDYKTLMEYLVNCPCFELKKLFVGLLYCAILKIHESETINNKLKSPNDNYIINNSYINEKDKDKDNKITDINNIDEELDDKPKTERQSHSIFSFFSAFTSSSNKNLPPIEQNVSNHLSSSFIPKILLKFINNIICLIKKINDDKSCMFLYYILYRFSLISPYTKDYLITKIPILTFLIYHLYPKYSERNIPSNFPLKVNVEIINPEHNNLAPMKNNEVGNIVSKDNNIAIYKKESYIKILLFNLMTGQRASSKLESCYDFSKYSFVVDLFNGIKTKQDADILSNAINKFCYNNWNSVKNLIEIFNKIIDVNECEKLDNIMLLYKRFIVDIHDDADSQISRIKTSLKQLFKVMNNNNRIYSHYDYCTKFIISLFMLNNEKMFDYVNYFSSNLEKIKNWYDENKIPPLLYNIDGIQMYKSNSSRNNNQNNNIDIKKFNEKSIEYSKKIINIIENILKSIFILIFFL